MEKTPPSRIQEILFASSDRSESKRITALLKEGTIRKIAPRIYSSNFSEEPATIIKRNWYRVLANLYPDAILSHRTALESKPTKEGHIYLTYIYTKNVELPGLTIHFLKGPSKIEGDNPFFENLYVSQEPRAFLENLQTTRLPGVESKNLPLSQLEERLESIIRARGEQGLNAIRDRAKKIAPVIGMEKELKKLNSLISDLLATGKSKNLKSPAGIARALGELIDPDRTRLFENLYEELAGKVFPQYKDKNTTEKAYKTFAFFEGYIILDNYFTSKEFPDITFKDSLENQRVSSISKNRSVSYAEFQNGKNTKYLGDKTGTMKTSSQSQKF